LTVKDQKEKQIEIVNYIFCYISVVYLTQTMAYFTNY